MISATFIFYGLSATSFQLPTRETLDLFKKLEAHKFTSIIITNENIDQFFENLGIESMIIQLKTVGLLQKGFVKNLISKEILEDSIKIRKIKIDNGIIIANSISDFQDFFQEQFSFCTIRDFDRPLDNSGARQITSLSELPLLLENS